MAWIGALEQTPALILLPKARFLHPLPHLDSCGWDCLGF